MQRHAYIVSFRPALIPKIYLYHWTHGLVGCRGVLGVMANSVKAKPYCFLFVLQGDSFYDAARLWTIRRQANEELGRIRNEAVEP
jgi:hypothetical protein